MREFNSGYDWFEGMSAEEIFNAQSPVSGWDTDKPRVRRLYSELVLRYHPDRNGGERSFEGRLNSVVEAYQTLRKSAALG